MSIKTNQTDHKGGRLILGCLLIVALLVVELIVFLGLVGIWLQPHGTIYSFSHPRTAFLDRQGQLIFWPVGLTAVTGYSEGFAAYTSEYRSASGFNTSSGFIGLDVIPRSLPYRFDKSSILSDGLALVYAPRLGGPCYINSAGEEKIEAAGNSMGFCRTFSDGVAAVYVENKGTSNRASSNARWGFINKAGHLVLPPLYAIASDFSSGRACVILADRSGQIGVIDHSGKQILTIESKALPRWSQEGFIVLWDLDRGQGQLLDRNGKSLLNGKRLENFQDGLGLLSPEKNSPLTFIDAGGKEILKINADRYHGIFTSDFPSFSNGFAPMVVAMYPGSLHKKASLYAQRVYQFIDKHGRTLPIDTNGKVITSVFPFNDGYAVVELQDMHSKQL